MRLWRTVGSGIVLLGFTISMGTGDFVNMLLSVLAALLLVWATNDQHRGYRPWHKIP